MNLEKRQDHILKLKVNGAELTTSVKPGDTLADVIRDKAHLSGTKIGCDMGTCGCCTVHVNGQPRLSCLTLALECQGQSIDTVEGLNEGGIHPLSQAFSDQGGSQCGYCTPGFIMTAAALLEKNSSPSMDDLKEELSGNLCRCTGFVKIYDAVLEAAQKMKDQKESDSDSQPSEKEPVLQR